jgi:hypothetical protein
MKYSITQNSSHTFSYLGNFDVVVYVTDSAGTPATETATITVKVDNGGSVLSATEDISLSGDGSTDNLSTFNTWISAQSDPKIVEFPSGTYRFTGTISVDDDGGASSFIFRAAEGATVVFDFDPASPSDSSPDTFLNLDMGSGAASKLLIQNISITANLQGGTARDNDNTSLYTAGSNGIAHFQNCTITNFTAGIRAEGVTTKCNVIDWGNGAQTDPEGRASFWYDGTNAYHRNNYSKSDVNHEHAVYTQEKRWMYFIGNYVDQSNAISGTRTIQYQGGTPPFQDQYFYRNYLDWGISSSSEGTIIINGDANRLEFIDNIAVNNVNAFLAVRGNTDGLVVDSNIFQTDSSDSDNPLVAFGMSGSEIDISNIELTNNVFGLRNDGPHYWVFYINAGCTGGCADDIFYSTINDTCSCADISGNIDDNTDPTISDPGQWEYTAPAITSVSFSGTTLTISASDADSGLGSTARFPFTDAALIQVQDDSGSWSQVQDYATETTWSITPTYVRVRDVDGNWSEPLQLNVSRFQGASFGSGASIQ